MPVSATERRDHALPHRLAAHRQPLESFGKTARQRFAFLVQLRDTLQCTGLVALPEQEFARPEIIEQRLVLTFSLILSSYLLS